MVTYYVDRREIIYVSGFLGLGIDIIISTVHMVQGLCTYVLCVLCKLMSRLRAAQGEVTRADWCARIIGSFWVLLRLGESSEQRRVRSRARIGAPGSLVPC